METMSPARLRTLQSAARWARTATLVLFIMTMVAQVSQWGAVQSVLGILCLCALAVWLVLARRYKRGFIRAIVEHSAGRVVRQPVYAPLEKEDGVPGKLGFAPERVPFAPGLRLHHTVRGALRGLPFMMAETAFVRMKDGRPGNSVAGTLISVEGALPSAEAWLLERGGAMDAVCAEDDRAGGGYQSVPVALPEGIVCAAKGEIGEERLLACASWLAALEPAKAPAALAVKDGRLSLLLCGSFYVPDRVDTSRAFQESMLDSCELKPAEAFDRLIGEIAG